MAKRPESAIGDEFNDLHSRQAFALNVASAKRTVGRHRLLDRQTQRDKVADLDAQFVRRGFVQARRRSPWGSCFGITPVVSKSQKLSSQPMICTDPARLTDTGKRNVAL